MTVFDGERVPADDGAFDLVLLSHVLEHVPDPEALLREAARVSRAVLLEVPLEANLSARRESKREGAAEIGEVRTEPPGMVLVRTAFGGTRVMDLLVGDPLPRIC